MSESSIQPAPRAILHVDMDQFFAAIAVLDDPALRGKPVLVGGDGPRAVVATASYEARKFGCHSAMPMAVAKRLCPQAVIVGVPGERIRAVSKAVFEVFAEFTPVIEGLSVDEAFLDVTGSLRLFGPPQAIARKLKDRIRERTQLTASVGVSFNKFLAKLASDLHKPDGLTIITPYNLDATLTPLPVGKLWGVGPKLQAQLEQRGIRTIGDLRRLTEAELDRRFGSMGEHLYRLSRGIDDRPVIPHHRAKSVGHEQTFSEDVPDPDRVRAVMLDQAQQVGRRLRAKGVKARGVTVKIRFGDFQTITRSTTLDAPTNLTEPIYHAARELFDRWAEVAFQPVRLIGISTHGLEEESQGSLFTNQGEEKLRRVDQVLDDIATRFGKRTIRRAGPK